MQTACTNATLLTVYDHHTLHSSQRLTTNPNYFATLTAVGELHLRLGTGPELEPNAAELLSGISTYIRDTDEVFTNLASGVSRTEETSILR